MESIYFHEQLKLSIFLTFSPYLFQLDFLCQLRALFSLRVFGELQKLYFYHLPNFSLFLIHLVLEPHLNRILSRFACELWNYHVDLGLKSYLVHPTQFLLTFDYQTSDFNYYTCFVSFGKKS